MELVISKSGIIHILAPGGGGEYTFCGLEIQQGSGDPGTRANYGKDLSLDPCTGRLPNCKECKDAIRQIREAIKGLRFAKTLHSIYDEEWEGGAK